MPSLRSSAQRRQSLYTRFVEAFIVCLSSCGLAAVPDGSVEVLEYTFQPRFELAVNHREPAGLREQWIGQDFRVADRLRLQRAADALQPLPLLGRPGTACKDMLHAVFDARL